MSQAKRRAGEQITADDFKADDEDDVPDQDPGEWRPVAGASVQNRRKVKARRAGDAPAAPAAPAADAPANAAETKPTASANPFSGVSLAAPSASSANPFSGINLQPPAAAKEEENPVEGEAPKSEEKKGEDAVGTSSATFATLASNSGAKPFGSWSGGFGSVAGGGFGSVTGATFGSMFAAQDAKKAAEAAEAGEDVGEGAKPLFGGSSLSIPSFSFNSSGAASFPLITPTFGSGGKPSPAGKDADGDGAKEGGEEGGGIVELFNSTAEFKPVVSLPVVQLDKVNEKEVERTVFSADGSLYEFELSSNKWKERGKGELRIINADGSAHMVMRQSGHFRLLLNAKVYAAMPVQRMGDVGKSNGLTFACVNAAGTNAAGQACSSAETTPAKDAAAGEEASESKEAERSNDAGPGGDGAAGSQKLATWAFKSRNHDLIERLVGVLEKAKAGELPEAAKKGDNLV